MSWSRILPVSIAVLAAGTVGIGIRKRHSVSEALAPVLEGASEMLAVARAPVDSARSELEAGRAWHASQILRTARNAGGLGAEETLLLARADLGWKNWNGVVEALAAQSWIDEANGGEPEHAVLEEPFAA